MRSYKYYIDKKQTIWEREYYNIEAKNQGEANRIARDIFNENPSDFIEPYEYETLYDTSEEMSLEDNNGFATKELFRDKDNKMLLHNGENR
jgi:hypothetical protein